MVGLPARGKSFIGRKIARYLNWRDHPTRIFNVGGYRRDSLGSRKDASFFDPDNRDARQARNRVAAEALDDAIRWLDGEGEVAIFDATNSTKERRKMILDRCTAADVDVTFVEAICDDPDVIDANIRATKLHLPDYADGDPDDAARDFRQRIEQYRRAYRPIEDESLSWIKLIVLKGGQHRIIVNRVDAPLMLRAAAMLVGFQSGERTIWLTRHGESAFNLVGRIGGDAPLSKRGEAYAAELARWMQEQCGVAPLVWTSTLQRTIQTAAPLPWPHRVWRALDEIDAGVCDGMTYDEIRQTMPDEFAARKADKLRYRYPRGESYLDVIHRLDPLVSEFERVSSPLLVIAHQAVLRALYAYLAGKPLDACPFLEVPLHTVIELAPGGTHPREEHIVLEPARS